MALIRQPKTAGFRPISRYDIFVNWLSKCFKALFIASVKFAELYSF